MKVEDFFNQSNIVELSFFNFRNAITAAYYANQDFEILKVNENFLRFFPVLGNVSNAYFPDVLEQLGVPGAQIDTWISGIREQGSVRIPEIHITDNGNSRVFALMSTRTEDDSFSYLNGIQGQFVDRTDEWNLRHEREVLLEQKIRDREIIEEKSAQLQHLANRLAKYLSPQIYDSIFSGKQDGSIATKRKNLTIFFSDIEQFTDLSEALEPERLTMVINSYLSEMSLIALQCGGTIDKFIGDAVMVFFGDPDSDGEEEDALKAVEMAMRMQQRVGELQSHWKKLGVPKPMRVRMGITSGYCTVGNFGSDQRLDYTVLGRPVNLAARLEGLADPGSVLISDSTFSLISEHVACDSVGEVNPKGFSRPVEVFKVLEFRSAAHRDRLQRRRLSRSGDHVEVNVIDSSDIRAAIEELRRIQLEFEQQLGE
ncbi:adenylate/guanylate cyclase domain-containing protein [Parasedimentitalea psychrophila]|uniref:Adenylate/guanylate cyclase domain-containing protein n=1 Tax=Parasedimentitalea psychrophila TaxID=2997337 RepID=A0A9Y2P3U4_9RHOB|nr:adenylate/guanylate cyclase domain-containing protein [Parasedimentitalea psychrophila]WIY26372.1 adenylate/guanylate cyclase domain-containing protein [Parasedimentitalea psychrophila]